MSLTGLRIHAYSCWQIPAYEGQDWSHKLYFSEVSSTALTPVVFNSASGQELRLGLRKEVEKGVTRLSIYFPYYMINHTGKTLKYKVSPDLDIPPRPSLLLNFP
jgi:hypothetical protein